MTVVQQSGLITPGHVPVFATNGVIQDGGALPTSTRVLAQAAKAGVAIQTYTMLTNTSLILWATLSSFGQNTRFSNANLGSIAGYLDIWFFLTTPQGGVASADIYLVGLDIST